MKAYGPKRPIYIVSTAMSNAQQSSLLQIRRLSMGKYLSKFTRWDSQRARPIHLQLLHPRPRKHLRGSWTSNFPRDPVEGLERRTTPVKVAHINDVFHSCQKTGHLQSVCMPKTKQDTGVSCLRQPDTIKTVRRSILPSYQQVKLHGHSQF